MEPIQFLKPGVTVFTSALYQMNSVLVETPGAFFLIDPGFLPFEIYKIREYVFSRLGDRRLYLIFTHSDYDHIAGYGAFKEATVIASRAFSSKINKSDDVRQVQEFDQRFNVEREYQIDYPAVDIEIEDDGKSMHFSGTVVTFYLAPGHTHEGLFIVFEPQGVWVAGDYLSDIEPPLVEDDLASYRNTISKTNRILSIHQIQFMVPGHGRVASSKNEMQLLLEHSLEYLDDLEHSQGSKSSFPFDKYRERYPFYQNFLEFHEINLEAVDR